MEEEWLCCKEEEFIICVHMKIEFAYLLLNLRNSRLIDITEH